MKIIIVAMKLDQGGGGSNRSLELLADNLQDDHNVELVTLRNDLNEIHDPPVPVQTFDSKSSKDTFKNCWKALKENDNSADIFHIFTPDLVPVGGLYRRRGDVPVVGRLNTYGMFCTNFNKMEGECYRQCNLRKKYYHDDNSGFRRTPRYLYKEISPFLASNVDRLFAISPSVKNIYKSIGITAPIKIVPNFYDPKFSGNTSGQVHNLSITYVGRLLEIKGVQNLLKGYSDARIPNEFKLQIVGDGPNSEKLKQIAIDEGIQENVLFEGWVPYNDLPNIFANSSLFVHPGIFPEPFGRTILEALQHSLPLVVSDIGGPPWVAKNAALTYSPHDISDLRTTLEEAVKEPTRSILAEKSKERAQRFSPDRVIGELVDEYRSVVKNQT